MPAHVTQDQLDRSQRPYRGGRVLASSGVQQDWEIIGDHGMLLYLYNKLSVPNQDRTKLWCDLFHGSSPQQISTPHLESVQRRLLAVAGALDGSTLLLVLAGSLLQLLDLGFHILGLPLQLLRLTTLSTASRTESHWGLTVSVHSWGVLSMHWIQEKLQKASG